MKYPVIAATALLLAGCAGGAGKISDRAKEIQDYTRIACSFVPTLATIAAILSSGTSAPVATIVADICAAVTTAPLADGPSSGPPKVYGVVIKGKFEAPR